MTFFKNCSFVIQLDRRSFTTDIIEYTNGCQVLSEDFKKAVTPICQRYGYKFNKGTSTDVGELVWNNIGICAFNFSNGSFNEHRDYETCSIPHLLNAINAGYEIIKELGYKKKWKHKNQPKFVKSKTDNYEDIWGDYWDKDWDMIPAKDIYDLETIKEFTNEWLLGRKSQQTPTQAALSYVYEEGCEDNILWMYDYYIGLSTSQETLFNIIYNYLNTTFGNFQEVRLLCKQIKKLSEASPLEETLQVI
jgi:hypothetical protein